MNTIQTRFGTIEYQIENLLNFPAGLIGLPNLRQFIVMPNKKKGPLFWIQSVDDPAMAFVLTNPLDFFPDYSVNIETSERATLGINEDDAFYLLSVVTVPPNQEITLNLAAPILFAPKTNRAIQIILEKGEYTTKELLPKVDEDQE
ncbi:MAG: flagellar assembly protein FliW [Desulfotalea sp.]